MKKVGKTTTLFRYNLNQTPCDYTVEVTNRFKGLDLIDRVPEKLWMEVCDIVWKTSPAGCWLLLLSHISRVQPVRPHRQQPTRLPSPWDSPGKNTGMGCHFLIQCMKAKSESEVTQSCPTLHNPMDCSLSGYSVHGIFQARVLEWGAIAFSKISPKRTQKAFS